MRTKTATQAGEFTVAMLHYGPGPHPDGSPQTVHGGGAVHQGLPDKDAGQMVMDFTAQPESANAPYEGVNSAGHTIRRAPAHGDMVTTVTSRNGAYRQTWRERDGQVIDWSETQFKKWRGKNQWVERGNWLSGRRPLPFPVPRTADEIASDFGSPVDGGA